MFRGSLRLAGRVRGDVTVINATLYLLPGADVEGDILVVGGRLIRSPGRAARGARAGALGRGAGAARRPRARWCCGSGGARSASWPRRATTLPDRPGPDDAAARHRAAPTTGSRGCRSSSARPSSSGPRRGTLARLDLRGILRTAGEGARLSSDFGYGVRAELRFPGGGVGGRLYSEVAPIEDQPLSAAENGWSAFLLQRDYRDYFERRGGGGAAWVQPTRSLRFELSLRRDHERSRPGHRSLVAAPEQRPVAPQSADRRRPLLHHRRSQLDLDTRNDRDRPTTGWLLRARYEHSHQRRRRSGGAARGDPPADSRPAAATPFDRLLARPPPLLPAHARRSGSTPGSAPTAGSAATGCRSSGASRSAAPTCCRATTSAPSPARRGASSIRRSRRSATARSSPRSRSAPGWGSTSATGCATARAGAGRFIGIEEADLVFLGDAARRGSRATARARSRSTGSRRSTSGRPTSGSGSTPGQIGAYLAKSLCEGEPVKFLVRLQRRF